MQVEVLIVVIAISLKNYFCKKLSVKNCLEKGTNPFDYSLKTQSTLGRSILQTMEELI